jgi:type IX secretion system PorP/SprF family membrane protein
MRLKISIILFIVSNVVVKAQDIHFSQFHFTPVVNNPSNAGKENTFRGVLNYRNQWKSVSTPYKTGSVTVDGPFGDALNSGSGRLAWGISVFSDQVGKSEMATLQGSGTLSYHLLTGEHSIFSAGLMAGYVSRSMNVSKLSWGNQFDGYVYDPSLPSGEISNSNQVNFFDLGAGLSFSFKKGEKYMTGNDQLQFNFGVAYFHPHKPDYSFIGTNERLNPKLVSHGEALLGIPNTNLSLVPSFILMNQGTQSEISAGTMFRYVMKVESNYTGFEKGSAISLGMHYRVGDAIIPSMMVELGSYALGVSYDINLSDLDAATSKRGGTEVAIRYMAPTKKRGGGGSRRY